MSLIRWNSSSHTWGPSRAGWGWSFEVGITTRRELCSVVALKCAHHLGLGQGAMILLSSLFEVHPCKEGAPKATMGWLHGKWRAPCPWYIALLCDDFLGHLHSKKKFQQERRTNIRLSDSEWLRSPNPRVSVPEAGVPGCMPGFLEGSFNKRECM